ncbi:arsenic resistance protein ArsH [Aspergillus aculeatinus CBS 121060]|uniref:Arsenic resistance protein ArsH n=1 Tax=Aspergillus aculeatinus CBS 121060 TaxID=1448322 RepID=A0ACD1H2U9_9EURO|nr:arsenic resistance protein ArsH [Aspergillus aculeatinus CBS 121060]RAH67855.1 arsenic resistance protein ArsH [Aspergillus aculeatinus CBS 121060]
MSQDTYNLVQSRYGDIAKQSTAPKRGKEDDIAKAFGYSAEDLSTLPEKTNLGLSCGTPVAFANVKEGETVLDLGSGSGIDVLPTAWKVGLKGQAIGVDMTKKNIQKAELSNARIIEANITAIPLPDASVDCIISNCVIILVPAADKTAVFTEMARLLKPRDRVGSQRYFCEKAASRPHYRRHSVVLSLAIPEAEDSSDIRRKYRPFILEEGAAEDWVNRLELTTAMDMAAQQLAKSNNRLKILVLYGSLRRRSYSRLVALEASRILFRLGCDVRVFDPEGLPVKNDTEHTHPKVQELRELSKWSDGHVWVSPEQHGNLTAVFKNQIDWIPLSTGSVRPTQGRTLAIAQVCGGSQSFNAVNSLRMLGRWMRMFTIPNQSSIPKAYTHFPDEGQPGDQRLLPSGNRDRLVDCMEEFVKYTILMRPHLELFGDRYSEREEKRVKDERVRVEQHV